MGPVSLYAKKGCNPLLDCIPVLFVVMIVTADCKMKLISSDQSTKAKLPKIVDNTCLKVENNPPKTVHPFFEIY